MLSGITGRKASVGGLISQLLNLEAQPQIAVETIRLEYSRGKGNFQWSGEMRRDWKEHRWRRHFTGLLLTLRDES